MAGYVLLIPRFKMWGAAAATLCAFSGVAVYSYWKAQRVKQYHYEMTRLSKIGLSACAASAVALIGAPEAVGGRVSDWGLGAWPCSFCCWPLRASSRARKSKR